MILTNCAACAAPLAHDAPRCEAAGLVVLAARFALHTRYCDATCQHDHWRRGHKQICKRIHRGGNAEQYNADKKYKEAVAVAAKACADDTKGQTCFICTQALHWKTKEGLVRGCACRGTAGFAHVSCLAEQAKILVAEAEENNLGDGAIGERWRRWDTCSLCEQSYHGVVRSALGWACWKTYVGRPEFNMARINALTQLGNGFFGAENYAGAINAYEAELSVRRRDGAHEEILLVVQSNLSCIYGKLGRFELANRMQGEVYRGSLRIMGKEHGETLREANNYASSLAQLERYGEAKALIRKTMPAARRVLGENHEFTLSMRSIYAQSLCEDPTATLDDVREAVTSLEETERAARRVLGGRHPTTVSFGQALQRTRDVHRARETQLSEAQPSGRV